MTSKSRSFFIFSFLVPSPSWLPDVFLNAARLSRRLTHGGVHDFQCVLLLCGPVDALNSLAGVVHGASSLAGLFLPPKTNNCVRPWRKSAKRSTLRTPEKLSHSFMAPLPWPGPRRTKPVFLRSSVEEPQPGLTMSPNTPSPSRSEGPEHPLEPAAVLREARPDQIAEYLPHLARHSCNQHQASTPLPLLRWPGNPHGPAHGHVVHAAFRPIHSTHTGPPVGGRTFSG